MSDRNHHTRSSLEHSRYNQETVLEKIRLQVYRHVFERHSLRAAPQHATVEGQRIYIASQPRSPIIQTLLICHQIHLEALPLFYALVKFRFERWSVSGINWPFDEVMGMFPQYCRQTQDTGSNLSEFASSRDLVKCIYYAGNAELTIQCIGTMFSKLEYFEFDLDWDHLGNDQTNFDRAMKYAVRNKEWRHAIKDALDQRFPDGMTRAVFDLQSMGPASRSFVVNLHWRLGYRFIEFEGDCNLDEWVLHVRDPDGSSRNVYDIRQDPLFHEMS